MTETTSQKSETRNLISVSGFTLVEMAMVIVIIGLIMLTVFPALTAARTATQRSLTQNNLQALVQATAAYVQANGCVPCPAPASVIGPGFGRVRGDGGVSPAACGVCSVSGGIPPFISLGIPATAAHDGWGHWISMSVDPALTINFGVGPPTTPAVCSCTLNAGKCVPSQTGCNCPAPAGNLCVQPFNASVQGLCAPSGTGAGFLSKAKSVSVLTPGGGTQSAAVLFISYGAQGFGSVYASAIGNGFNGAQVGPFPSNYLPCSATAGFAQCNAFPGAPPKFVNAPMITANTDPYDDMLVFADRNTLVSMLGNGSCQTVW